MNQSSWDDTLLGVRPSPGPGRGAVSPQSSRDKRRKRSLPGSTVRREGRAISVVADRPAPAAPGLRRDRRRWAWGPGAAALVLWSLAGAGLFTEPVLNPAGWGEFRRFAGAALHPELDGGFLRVVAGSALVVTVDTMIAHLAGVLGRPAWLLLRHDPDWRWPVPGTRTPWYPTMRVFRQPAPGDWDAVMAEVRQALEGSTRQRKVT